MMAAASLKSEKLMSENRHALNDGLGRDGEDYMLISLGYLTDLSNVGVAHCVKGNAE